MKFVTILLPVKLTTPCDNISFSLWASYSKYDTTSVSYFPTGNLYVQRCAARPGRSLAKKNMNCGQQSEFWSVPCKLITAGLQNPTQHFTLSDLDWPLLQSTDHWPLTAEMLCRCWLERPPFELSVHLCSADVGRQTGILDNREFLRPRRKRKERMNLQSYCCWGCIQTFTLHV